MQRLVYILLIVSAAQGCATTGGHELVEALRLDWNQDGTVHPRQVQEARAWACKAGSELACRFAWDGLEFPAAAAIFEPACEKGDAAACVGAGWALSQVAKNGDVRRWAANNYQAAVYFRRACDAGLARGCVELGRLYRYGYGVDKDVKQAYRLFSDACQDGHLNGCVEQSWALWNGRGVGKDRATGERILSEACKDGSLAACWDQASTANDLEALQSVCDDGYGAACTSLGWRLHQRQSNTLVDWPRAVGLSREACAMDDALGCNNLGLMLAKGDGVPADQQEAMAYYRTGCELGAELACRNLAYHVLENQTPATDLDWMVRVLELNCDGGHSDACVKMGRLHRLGRGVPQDNIAGREYARRACSLKDKVGCNNLGIAFMKGFGGPQDEKEGVRLVEKACNQGYGLGCSNAALYAKDGLGQSRDPAKSKRLYAKACRLGFKSACNK